MNNPMTSSSRPFVSTDELGKQIEALRADLSRLGATVADDMATGIDRAGRQISKTGREARSSARDAVLEHPLTAVGLAAGLGFLMGMIARRN